MDSKLLRSKKRIRISKLAILGYPNGFTLVELIVVITILAILATVGFLSLSGYSDDARTATVKANVRTVYSAILTESTTSGNSPRYYVDHGTGAALSGAFVFVDGKQVALTGGNVGETPTDSNYTAGNPRWDRLRMNGEKFRLSSGRAGAGGSGLPYAFRSTENEAWATYSTGELAVGAVDIFKTGANGRKRATPFFQVAGVVSGSKVAVVSGNLAGGTAGGLVKDPSSADPAYSLADGAPSTSTIPESCNAIKSGNSSVVDWFYRIDSDGTGPNVPYTAYCDMTTDGGGWTLAIRLNTNDATKRKWDDTAFWGSTSEIGSPYSNDDYLSRSVNMVPKNVLLKYVYQNNLSEGTWASFENASNSNSLSANLNLAISNSNPVWTRKNFNSANPVTADFYGSSLVFESAWNTDDRSRIFYNSTNSIAACNQGWSIWHIGDYGANNWNWEVARWWPDATAGGNCQHNSLKLWLGSNYDPVSWGISPVTPTDLYYQGIMYVYVR